ncbi:MAG: UDP-N-acetylmuramate dehydrogenase [Armatimonadota bacterium]
MIAAPVIAVASRQLELAAEELGGSIRGRVRLHEPMSRHTTFRIGGPADIFVQPADVDDLAQVMRFSQTRGIPLKVIGNGSNLLVSDAGIRGIVVRLTPGFSETRWLDDGVEVGGGARLAKLVAESCKTGLSGLESLVGIPGTLGGALATNAGTDTGSIGDLVVSATVLGPDGTLSEWRNSQFAYRYRHSTLRSSGAIVVSTRLRLQPAPTEETAAKVSRLRAKRAGRQPLRAWCAGSVFKNLRAVAAGKVLDRAGAKGRRIGGAQVSPKHANFLVNRGSATAEEMRQLIEWAHSVALRKYGIDLELEIEFVGERFGQ